MLDRDGVSTHTPPFQLVGKTSGTPSPKSGSLSGMLLPHGPAAPPRRAAESWDPALLRHHLPETFGSVLAPPSPQEIPFLVVPSPPRRGPRSVRVGVSPHTPLPHADTSLIWGFLRGSRLCAALNPFVPERGVPLRAPEGDLSRVGLRVLGRLLRNGFSCDAVCGGWETSRFALKPLYFAALIDTHCT